MTETRLIRVGRRRAVEIMPEYTQRPQRRWFRPTVVAAVAGLVLFGLLYGAIFAFIAPYLLIPLLTPLIVALAVVIWVLPEARTAPSGAITVLLFAFLLGLALWPNYLAISLPGIPWITISRLTGAPLCLLLLYSLSTSSQVRQVIGKSISGSRFVFVAYIFFLLTQLLTLFLSKHLSDSIDKFVTAQFGWTSILFVSMFVFAKPENARRFAQLLWFSAVVMAIVAVFEWRHKQILWAGHIPSFLQVSDETLASYLRGSSRAYSGVYRAQAMSSTSIGLGEYLTLAAPFVLYFTNSAEKIWTRAAAAASVAIIFGGIFVSDSRSGMIGFALTLLSFGLASGVRAWRSNRASFIGVAISLSYPVMVVAAVAASFMFHAIRVKIWGGGAQQASTDARFIQMHKGVPLVLKNPLGYGMGQGGGILDFHLPSGQLTIDNYYLSLALDFGVLGLAAFVVMIVSSMAIAARMEVQTPPNEAKRTFYLPIFQSLLAFFVIKSVFSQQDNHPVIYMMIGLLLALVARDRASGAKPGARWSWN